MLRDDYVQANGMFLSKGAYLQPGVGQPASLDPADPSRFRPTSYVLPRQIEIMNGSMDLEFQNENPLQSDTRVIPYSTYIKQPPAPSSLLRARRGGRDSTPLNVPPYGSSVDGPVSPSTCSPSKGCSIQPSGGCFCKPSSPLYNPKTSNVYY